MTIVKNIIYIFLEIAFDFKQVFSFYAEQTFAFFMQYAEKCTDVIFVIGSLFLKYTNSAIILFESYIGGSIQRLTKEIYESVPNLPKASTFSIPAILTTYTNTYITLLAEIYTELEDAVEKDTIPLFFIVATVLILMLGSSIFFLALVH